MDKFVIYDISLVFTVEEIEIISAGVDEVFQEFFKESDTYLSIHGVQGQPGHAASLDNVIHCYNKISKKTREAATASALCIHLSDFGDFIRTTNDNLPHLQYSLRTSGSGILVGSIGFKTDVGMVFFYCAISKNEEALVRNALYGLALIICKVLAKRSKMGEDLLRKIKANVCVDNITQNAIEKRVNQFLHI